MWNFGFWCSKGSIPVPTRLRAGVSELAASVSREHGFALYTHIYIYTYIYIYVYTHIHMDITKRLFGGPVGC